MNVSIDKYFSAIKNGTWHSIDQLSNELPFSANKIKELSKLFSERGLLKYDKEKQKIKIQPIWTLLLPTEEEAKTQKNTIANFIIPPHASVDVQSTHISNLSNVEVELTLRINNKISEIAITA